MSNRSLDNSSKRIAFCGIMTALAIVFGYVEHIIPFPIGIYGLKLGLANLVVMVMLYTVSWHTALAINLLRIFISFILFGSATSLIYSLFGGVLSFLIMLALKGLKRPSFSPIGVSICGAVTHNLGQIFAALLLLEEFRIALYIPVLITVGALTGTLIGVISFPIIKRFSRII